MGTENDIRIFCENIRNLRNEEKLSKTRMAKILGISIKTLTQIENGIVPNRVTCRLLFRIYDNFKIFTVRDNDEKKMKKRTVHFVCAVR